MTFDKNKVYTALNADEVKVGSVGCFADTIADLKNKVKNEEFFEVEEILPEDRTCCFVASCGFYNSLFYLVEEPEEETYRPYENTDEMIEDFKERAKKHYNANFFKCPMFHTSIWVKNKKTDCKSLITDFSKDMVFFSDIRFTTEELFDKYTYLDGTPCGKKI